MFLLVLIIIFIFGSSTTILSDIPDITAKGTGLKLEEGKAIKEKLSVSFADPEMLFPSEEITVIPAFSKFFLEADHILGSNSKAQEISILSKTRMEKLLIAATIEIEDFAYRNGLIYLLAYREAGPGIMILDREGNILSQFPLVRTPPGMTSIAVDSKGNIYHNNPSLPEGIITVYDSFGRVKKIFGKHLPEKYFASMKLLNRVVLCVDGNDHLILAFRFNPIVRKYDSNGELLFEQELSCKEILQRAKTEKDAYPERFTLTDDGRVKIRAFTYFTSVACDAKNNIYLKFGPESLIFRLDKEGLLNEKLLLIHGEDSIEDFDFWESSIVVREGFLYFPREREGSESFGSILKYKLHK
ncbi:MAG: hypothetical protein AB1756_03355 [Acidobacteriota bacterium]